MAADSTAMTIDFLRARLLSERSISRASRERADQLAKRVAELEEQLRIVIHQRKNAEKAATEVLSILESQGFGYLTEPELIDSSSDQDEDLNISPVTKECDLKEKAEVADELSESELANETPPAGSLSWKRRSKSPDSHKKNNNKLKQFKQRQRRVFYFMSPDPSPKYQLGKSCRKIKPSLGADQEERENSKCSTDSKNNENNNENENENENEEEEMERALEEQANLIGRFEEEENAQREWEKIYNENRNSSILEDAESENKECIEEKGCEDKKEVMENTELENKECTDENSSEDTKEIMENRECTDENSCEDKKEIVDHIDEKSEQIEEPKFNSEILSSNGSITEKYDHNHDHEISYEKAIVVVSDVQIRDDSNETNNNDSHSNHNDSNESNINDSHSNDNESNNDSHSNYDDSNPLALQLYQPPIDKISNVLEALKRAKISLWENLSKKKSHEYKNQEILAITEHGEQNTDTDINTQHIINIPIGNSDGLFRLPTDSFPGSEVSNSVLNLEYSKDLMGRFSNEEYFDSRNAQLALHDSFSSTSSNNDSNNQFGFGSNSRFYEDLRRGIPAGDRLFLYGGNCSFDDMDML